MVGGATVLGVMLLRTNVVNTHRLQAAYMAQEAFEIVKQIRDTNYINPSPTRNWDDGLTECSSDKCYIDLVDDRFRLRNQAVVDDRFSTTLNSVKYSRVIQIENDVNNNAVQLNEFKKQMKKVTVIVTWQDYGKEEKYQAETLISDWKPI